MFARVVLSVLGFAMLSACNGAQSSSASPVADEVGEPVSQSEEKSSLAAPLALVYRGPAGCDGCSEAVAALLRSSRYGFQVRYVGPGEALSVNDAALSRATLYAQPGGDGTLDDAYEELASAGDAIRRFVRKGGRYLGICMGGYLAGSDPGFDLLPGDVGRYIATSGADVTDEDDAVIQVQWGSRMRSMYFQDGPYFTAGPAGGGSIVLARYASNNRIAATVAPYGRGKVAVSGPHPEATRDWYRAADLADPDGVDSDLGHELIDAVMR